MAAERLLGPADVRELVGRLSVRPTKVLGQNFVTDANTVRRIVRLAALDPQEPVLEVGPGLGSLTLALLQTGAEVSAVEIDPVLAEALPQTVAEWQPDAVSRLRVLTADALRLTDEQLSQLSSARALVANLPYNVAVPVVLTLLHALPALRHGLVMVQWEVAQRLAAAPGTADYGAPSAKAAWYAKVSSAGAVGRQVFWPVPNVESGLVRFVRQPPPVADLPVEEVFACVDAAFAQRRKTLRVALAGWAGSAAAAADALRAAGVDPGLRGERLSIEQFAQVARHRPPRDA